MMMDLGIVIGIGIGYFLFQPKATFHYLSELPNYGEISGKPISNKDLSDQSKTKLREIDQLVYRSVREVLESEYLAKNNVDVPTVSDEVAKRQLEQLKNNPLVSSIPEENRMDWVKKYLRDQGLRKQNSKVIEGAWKSGKIKVSLDGFAH